MFFKKKESTNQTLKEAMVLLDQINHNIDLRGLDSYIWDEVAGDYVANPHTAEVDRLTNDLKTLYLKGNTDGTNWNKLPHPYKAWLDGYISDIDF